MKKITPFFIGVFLLMGVASSAQNLVINEILTSNTLTNVDEDGSYIDGVKLSNVTIGDLGLDGSPIKLRLGNKPNTRNAGGLTLFGEKFGNYEQDLVLRIGYDALDDLHRERRG